MEHQFKQGMAGPDWELEDYDWWGERLPVTCGCHMGMAAASVHAWQAHRHHNQHH